MGHLRVGVPHWPVVPPLGIQTCPGKVVLNPQTVWWLFKPHSLASDLPVELQPVGTSQWGLVPFVWSHEPTLHGCPSPT